VKTPTSRSHVTAKLTIFCLYATRPVEWTDVLPVDENAMGPVQSTLVFFTGDRDGIGLTAIPTDQSKVHNHSTLVLYILLV